MKISIVIPFCNAEETIQECVNSFLEQAYSELELILVNDHSTDNSEHICLGLQRMYPQIRYIVSDKKGVSAARNAGLNIASGDVIGFCDADDTSVMGALSEIVEIFSDNSELDIIVGGVNVIFENNRIVYYGYKKNLIWNNSELASRVVWDDRIRGSVWNKYFRSSVLCDIRFSENLTYCEDMHFLSCLLNQKENIRVQILGGPIYNYRYNPKSVTNDASNMFNEENKLKYLVAMDAILNDCNLSLKMNRIIKRKKYVLAVDVLYGFNLSREQKIELEQKIEQNKIYFWKTINIGFFNNVKWLIVSYIKKCKYSRKKQHK